MSRAIAQCIERLVRSALGVERPPPHGSIQSASDDGLLFDDAPSAASTAAAGARPPERPPALRAAAATPKPGWIDMRTRPEQLSAMHQPGPFATVDKFAASASFGWDDTRAVKPIILRNRDARYERGSAAPIEVLALARPH